MIAIIISIIIILSIMKLTSLPAASVSGNRRGFSIIEMVLFISIIGIIAGMGVIQFVILKSGPVDETRYKRNAQELASVCNIASAAGLDFAAGHADLTQTINRIITGAAPADGAFKGQTFTVRGVDRAEVSKIAKYLHMENGVLVYAPSGQG